ncbi:prepilin-type N-terminal cleavage/methylation domain-containing protein [uncultured Clostridium sp.]|uniref:prepilin-type N-terminal cleavage/methylation domain-containing protein n=1 Tax=uncultured Clostridium sp. TaxID=59620 RepID=UPI0025EFBF0A|nr:prepilin-type N-terminal cleavage/methylation domain-containing protein [uncultured Clostridium sp.]
MNKLILNQKKGLKQDKKKGFTLVELIIVIAIIAILAAMAIPKFSAVRTDSKVSNDVAAAKNIQTQVATLIANGTMKAGDDINDLSSTSDENAKDIRNKLDGKANTGKTEAVSGVFKVEIGSSENITVSATVSGTDYELYPDNNGEGRKDYSDKAAGKTKKSEDK